MFCSNEHAAMPIAVINHPARYELWCSEEGARWQ
jgi:heme/copper-type cytochrome/quinol oxidase subunit 2